MTKVAYLDCPTGIAGDMCLGALVDAGVPLEYLVETLRRLGNASEYSVRSEFVQRNGQQATKVHVDLQHEHPQQAQFLVPAPAAIDRVHDDRSNQVSPSHSHAVPTRHLPEIEQMIQSAGLPPQAETWSLAVFRRLAAAEGAVHGISPAAVHFHEVGAIDAIVDIVGTCLGLDWLGIEKLYCSALPTGGGTVRAAHGRLPVPTPAVLKLWEARQIPIYSNGIERELVTPTGAAIVTTLATQFGPPPAMQLLRVGLGAGSITLPLPNILRLWIGDVESGEQQPDSKAASSGQNLSGQETTGQETIAVLETQLDDLSPQAIGYVLERLLAIGALDVFTQAIGMKKSRPGLLLTVICRPESVNACKDVIFRETTTLGIRQTMQQRHALQRQIQSIQTPYGAVRVKIAWDAAHGSTPDQPLNVQPEYEDCAAIAREQKIPWLEVHRLVVQHWQASEHSHAHPIS